MRKAVFTILLGCLFFIHVNGQSTGRYIKEITVKTNIIQYEMFSPDYNSAAKNYSDAKLNQRYSNLVGFISIARSAADPNIFIVTLSSQRAEALIKGEMFDFRESEITRINQTHFNNN